MAYTINIPKSSVFISKGEYESLFAGLSLKILGFTDFPLISGSLLKPLLYYLQLKSLPRAVFQVCFLQRAQRKKFPVITIRRRKDNMIFKKERKQIKFQNGKLDTLIL